MNPVRVSKEDILRIEPSDKVRLIKVIAFEKAAGVETVILEMKEAEKWA